MSISWAYIALSAAFIAALTALFTLPSLRFWLLSAAQSSATWWRNLLRKASETIRDLNQVPLYQWPEGFRESLFVVAMAMLCVGIAILLISKGYLRVGQ